jgi:hypothetical protein
MKEKKGYSQKTIEYIEHNPDLNILELSIKRKKEFITNASKINNDLDHIICNEFPVKLIPLIENSLLDKIIKKGIYIRKEIKKVFKLAILLNNDLQILDKIGIKKNLKHDLLKVVYELNEENKKIIHQSEKLIIFNNNEQEYQISDLLSEYTGEVIIQGKVPVSCIDYLSHFDNIYIEDTSIKSIRKCFFIIKDTLEQLTEPLKISKNDFVVTHFNQIYGEASNKRIISKSLFINNAARQPKALEIIRYNLLEEIFSSENFIDRISEVNDILEPISFILFTKKVAENRDKNLINNLILFCHLFIYLESKGYTNYSIALDIPSIDKILSILNHQSSSNKILDEFTELTTTENEFNLKVISKPIGRFFRYFFPDFNNCNSNEILFRYKLFNYINKPNTKTHTNELLKLFLSRISNNFDMSINYELLVLLLDFDQDFFISNILDFKNTRMGLEIYILLSSEISSDEINKYIIKCFPYTDDYRTHDQLCTYTVLIYYFKNFLNLNISFNRLKNNDDISLFAENIFDNNSPIKYIKYSPFHLALFSYYFISEEMLDDNTLLLNQLRYYNVDIVKHNYFLQKLLSKH